MGLFADRAVVSAEAEAESEAYDAVAEALKETETVVHAVSVAERLLVTEVVGHDVSVSDGVKVGERDVQADTVTVKLPEAECVEELLALGQADSDGVRLPEPLREPEEVTLTVTEGDPVWLAERETEGDMLPVGGTVDEVERLGEVLWLGDAVADRVLMLDGTVGRAEGVLVRDTDEQAESDRVAVELALRR